MNETKKRNTPLWQRILALACGIALFVSMFSFLTRVKSAEEDGIGADVLLENDPYVNASATERLSYAAVSFLMLGERFQQCYQRASFYIGKGSYERALEQIELCLSMCRESTDVSILDDLWLKYGCIQAVLGQYEAALTGFENISGDSAFSAEKEIVSAQIALEKGQMTDAFVHLTEYLRLSPEDASVYGLYADCCYYVGKPEEAVKWYDKAEQAGIAMDGSEYMLWCMCLMDTGDSAAALDMARKALELGYADTSLCYSQCAICCYTLGQFETCLEYGAKALESDSESVDYGMLVLYMGLATFALEEYSGALAYFDTAESLGCTQPDLWFYRGFCKMLTEDPQGAIEDFSKSEQSQEQHYNSCLYRGICRLQIGDNEQAMADLEEAARSPEEATSASAKELLTQLAVE